jgi:hypothetical protein
MRRFLGSIISIAEFGMRIAELSICSWVRPLRLVEGGGL